MHVYNLLLLNYHQVSLGSAKRSVFPWIEGVVVVGVCVCYDKKRREKKEVVRWNL